MTDSKTWEKEIYLSRKFTRVLTSVPEANITGFRFPYLAYNGAGFQVLESQNYEYDSSLIDVYDTGLSNSTSLLWPYTLDYGVAVRNIT
jgi:hypothetical protein